MECRRYTCVNKAILCALVLSASLAVATVRSDRSFVEKIDAGNVALIVGVSHGLPGIDIDVDNMEVIAKHSGYQFQPTILQESQGTKAGVARDLTKLSETAGKGGTLFFYYSGHGSVGSIYLQDGSLQIDKIRAAVEAGRPVNQPLERFVFIVDSCYSGSLLDPLRTIPLAQLKNDAVRNVLFADAIVNALTSRNERGEASNYWKKLFVFASSRADESSLAGYDGSVFTNALVKAFNEVEKLDGTMDDFVKKTQDYTKGHHPVARFVPEQLSAEKLIR